MSLKWNTIILTYSNLNTDTLVKLLLTCALSTKDIEDRQENPLFWGGSELPLFSLVLHNGMTIKGGGAELSRCQYGC